MSAKDFATKLKLAVEQAGVIADYSALVLG
jgi:hypothetical protein